MINSIEELFLGYLKVLYLSIGAVLLTSCATKKIVIATDEKIIKPMPVKVQQIQQEKRVSSSYQLNQRERDFMDILKDDRYLSLCSSKSLYKQILLMPNGQEKSQALKELFVTYTKNLANGCIDIRDMKHQLAKRRAQKIKSHYEISLEHINKKQLLAEYANPNITIKDIFNPYLPKEPQYAKLVNYFHKKGYLLSRDYKRRLRLNIERFKLMKPLRGGDFIELNIPTYSFDFYRNKRVVMHFGTVVGDFENQTPVLSSKLSYFIVNPAWNIPDSIAKKTIIPRMLKDKRYLHKKGIVIHKNYHLSSKKFRQQDIHWKRYLKENVHYIPYKFIQLPSKTNGLGRVKFIFANKYAVYMHDTIGKWRFKIPKQKIRAVSHGCVRLQNPLALMKYITIYYTPKSYATVRKYYDSHEMHVVHLSRRIPLFITYITTSIDAKNKIHFYKDIYGYDTLQKLNFSL